MAPKLSVTYFQFRISLSEFLDDAVIYRYQSEAFVQYAIGMSVAQVAAFIEQMENESNHEH